MPRVLIAGIGNVLRGDDGFGPAVIAALERAGDLPANATTADCGTGGFTLVRELLDGYEALVIVDAVDRGGPPGTVYLLQPTVPAVDAIDGAERRRLAADMHNAVPDRALLLARAAGVLPARVWIVGCQPDETEEFSTDLSAPVGAAVIRALNAIRSIVQVVTA
jgi:hydrogenase maturation protease